MAIRATQFPPSPKPIHTESFTLVHVYIGIYLQHQGTIICSFIRKPYPTTARSARTNAKKLNKAHNSKPPTPTPTIYALSGDEEQSGKQKEEEKERNKELTPNRANLDYSIASYDPHGSCGLPGGHKNLCRCRRPSDFVSLRRSVKRYLFRTLNIYDTNPRTTSTTFLTKMLMTLKPDLDPFPTD